MSDRFDIPDEDRAEETVAGATSDADFDPETPEADALEQQQEVDDRGGASGPRISTETPEADAIEQSHTTGYDDEYAG